MNEFFDRWMDQRWDEWVDGWINGSLDVVTWINEYFIDGWFYRVIYLKVGS